ncbi:hypothetical protein KP509_03G098200 [Ceratopteris richardii]|uniref:PGG domain-containing protein n=1 Tax=Ceratopteris richardii TaxID=49495 RepID=A0A8T2VAG6_CERRI|nr:hypothetical protein KP509_03G098200 [Ceratopteris richardii]
MERDQRQGEGRAAADVDANEIQAMDDIQQGLLAAARNGETTTIKGILSELDDQTRRRYLLEGYPNRLPLHAAAAAGHKKVLEILIPPDPEHPKAVDSKTKKRQLTALHLAVIHGHKDVSRWLVQERHANIDLGEEGGLTALHLAMKFQRREVVQLLVSLKANPFILDSEGRFPISDCKSERMFQAFFSKFPTSTFSSIQVNASATDRYGRTILHYAAQCANSDVIANLLPEEHSNLYVKDTNGDSVFHIAAKYGNMELFKALDIASIDINPRFFPPEEFDNHLLKSPAMCALLHDQRKFFDELVRRGLAKITLSSIIKALILELKEKPKITDRLELLGRTLPTYLALYANKDFVFDFLLFNGLTLNQQDDKYCRTCLHWAIDDGRTDIVQKIMKNRKVEPWPGIEDRDGKTAQQLAFEKEDEIGQMITLLLNRKSSFKEHEERLNRDREVYVQALNAILVGAALIASVTFAGWLQVPYGSEFSSSAMRVYWAANSISFFTAVATMCVTKIGLIPTPGQYVGAMVNHLRVAILLDAFLLALSLAAVMLAFGAAGFAALRQAHIESSREQL